MTVLVAIHQPNYLPYIGFFNKMSLADLFVLYDTAQFSRNGFHNRNQLKTPRGRSWLTIPVHRPTQQEIRFIEIDQSKEWAAHHWQTIEANYSRAAHFEDFRKDLRRLYARPSQRFSETTESFIGEFVRAFGIQTRIMRSSDLSPPEGLSPSSTLVEIVRLVGGDAYLSGPAGKDYLDPTAFTDVRLMVQDFHHPEYPQLWGPFEPNLSAMDLLLNTGSEAADILANSGTARPWP